MILFGFLRPFLFFVFRPGLGVREVGLDHRELLALGGVARLEVGPREEKGDGPLELGEVSHFKSTSTHIQFNITSHFKSTSI